MKERAEADRMLKELRLKTMNPVTLRGLPCMTMHNRPAWPDLMRLYLPNVSADYGIGTSGPVAGLQNRHEDAHEDRERAIGKALLDSLNEEFINGA